MKPFAVAALLAALCACGGNPDSTVTKVTIFAPNDTQFVQTIHYDARTHRVEVVNVGEPPVSATLRHPFPAPPVDALRWVAENGGFKQPIETMQASQIVGVRVNFANGPPLQTRFAGAWDVNEPEQLKTVQSWYGRVLYAANVVNNGWRHALAYTIQHHRVRAIEFIKPGIYSLTVYPNGNARIATGHGRTVRYASGHVDPHALSPIYEAALGLSPRAPVYAADDPPMHVEIIGAHRTYVSIGSNDPALELFAARMDQLAHDVHWSRRVAL